MKKLLTLSAVLAAAFFMACPSQAQLQTDTAKSAPQPIPGSLPTLNGTNDVTSSTQMSTTALVQAPKPPLTVIIGKDTLHADDTLHIPNQGYLIPADQVDGVPIPPIVQLLLVVLGTIAFTVLPAIQAVLKVIPTEKSVLIQGWLGKILNFATAFIKDAKAGGGFHQ